MKKVRYFVTKLFFNNWGWQGFVLPPTGCAVLDNLEDGGILEEAEFKRLFEAFRASPEGWEWDERNLQFSKFIVKPDVNIETEEGIYYEQYYVVLTPVGRTKDEAVEDLTQWLWENRSKRFEVWHDGDRTGEEEVSKVLPLLFTEQGKVKAPSYEDLYLAVKDALSTLLKGFNKYEGCSWIEWLEPSGWYLDVGEEVILHRQYIDDIVFWVSRLHIQVK